MDVSKSYAQNEVSGLGQIETESRALIVTASTLNGIKEQWDTRQGELADALEKNRKLWTIIASAIQDGTSPQPENVKKSILNLAMFVFQRTMSIMVEPKPEMLNVLISINMNLARGLGGNGADD